MKTMEIIPIPAFKDNYIWALLDVDSKTAWVVDPGEALPVLKALNQIGFGLAGILLTHHHYDHSGGIKELIKQWQGIPVIGSHLSPISEITLPVKTGDEIACATFQFKVLEIPGHTLDHIAFYNDQILFCGDTLFSAGCGRVFEGSYAQMYHSLSQLMQLSDEILVYCAHEYTLANLHFAEQVEPFNPFIAAKIQAVNTMTGICTLPSVLSEEKQFNPFLRCTVPEVIKAVEQHVNRHLNDSVEVFTALREWKNRV